MLTAFIVALIVLSLAGIWYAIKNRRTRKNEPPIT